MHNQKLMGIAMNWGENEREGSNVFSNQGVSKTNYWLSIIGVWTLLS